jgi:Fic family protein
MQIINLKDKDLTHEMILTLHGEIARNTIENHEYEGKYRDTDDIVVSDRHTGEVFHTLIVSDKIEETMRELCVFVNDEKVFIHPLVKGTMIHYLVGYIHPFVDGNGRMARSLFLLVSPKKGYWIIEFLSLSKAIKKRQIEL